MTYQKALSYIHSTLKFGSKPGLERIGRLLDKLGNPQESLRFVHVTGTNGKGSVCKATASVLQAAGYKTGLYISPYVTDFCERIQVDGRNISHAGLAQAVAKLAPFVEETAREFENPTEFEIITALAFCYFKETCCDVVVLEVGLGGRYDATNIIGTPLVSVLTTISYDHMAVLGDTLTQIAGEKCGIIKAGGATVTSPAQTEEALAVITRACAERGNALIVPDLAQARVLGEGLDGIRLLYRGHRLTIPLCGRHQVLNFTTVYETAVLLRDRGFAIPDAAIAKGFKRVRFPARMEILNDRPLVILDGGHNPSAARALADCLDRYLAGRPLTAVMGIFGDKDYRAVIPQVAARAAHFIAVRPDNPRALAPETTAQIAAGSCPDTRCIPEFGRAFEAALACAGPDGVILICGSFYLAGPMRRIVFETLKKRQNQT